MKAIVIGFIALLSSNLNAQQMKTPSDIVTTLFVSTDQRAWDQVKNSFNSKVWLDYSSMTGNQATELSPDQIIGAWKGILPGFESTHHQIGNVLTAMNGDRAEVFCYGTATHYLTDDAGSLWTVVGTYDFELLKIEGNWLISSMKFNFKYQDGNTSLPEKAMNRLK